MIDKEIFHIDTEIELVSVQHFQDIEAVVDDEVDDVVGYVFNYKEDQYQATDSDYGFEIFYIANDLLIEVDMKKDGEEITDEELAILKDKIQLQIKDK